MAVNQVLDSPARTTRSRHGFSQSEQVPAIRCITEKWIRKRLNLQLDSLGQFTSINFTCPVMTWVLRMMVMAFLSLVARTYPRKRGSGGIQMIPLGFERDIIRNFMSAHVCMCAWCKDKQLILQPGLSDCRYSQGFVKPYHAAKYVQWLIRKLECQIQKCILCTLGPAPWDKKAAQNYLTLFLLSLVPGLVRPSLAVLLCTNFILQVVNTQGLGMRLLSAGLEDLETQLFLDWLQPTNTQFPQIKQNTSTTSAQMYYACMFFQLMKH